MVILETTTWMGYIRFWLKGNEAAVIIKITSVILGLNSEIAGSM